MEFQTSSSFLQITQTECRTFLLKKYEGKKNKFADVLHKIKPKSLPHSQSLQKGIKSSLMNLT